MRAGRGCSRGREMVGVGVQDARGAGAWLSPSLLTINKSSRGLSDPVTSACLATFARSGQRHTGALKYCLRAEILGILLTALTSTSFYIQCGCAYNVVIHTEKQVDLDSSTPSFQLSDACVKEAPNIRLSDLITSLGERTKMLHEVVPEEMCALGQLNQI